MPSSWRRARARDDRARPDRRGAALGSGQDHGHARPSRRAATHGASPCAPPSPAPITSIRRFMPRRPASEDFNLDTWAMPAVARSTALIAETARQRRAAGDRRRDGVVRRRAGSARPLRCGVRSRRAVSASRCCSCSTCRGSRSRRPRSRAGFALVQSEGPCRRRRAQQARQRAPSLADGRCARAARHTGAGRDPARRHHLLPERHLGLVQAGEHADLRRRLDRLRRPGGAPSRSRRHHRAWRRRSRLVPRTARRR